MLAIKVNAFTTIYKLFLKLDVNNYKTIHIINKWKNEQLKGNYSQGIQSLKMCRKTKYIISQAEELHRLRKE